MIARYYSLQTLMMLVLIALLPAIFVRVWAFGFFQLLSLAILLMWGFFLEYLFSLLLKTTSYLFDASYLVSALIFWLSLPSDTSIFILCLGMTFGLVFGKFIFGGTGLNIFNPSMLAFLFVLLNFPTISYQSSIPFSFDSVSGPTILSSEMIKINEIFSLSDKFYIYMNLAYLVGGLFLASLKVIHLRVPIFVILGVIVGYFVLNSFTKYDIFTLLYGGSFLFLAFFIATDPVSLPQNKLAQIIVALVIGAVSVGIRLLSSKYPDGIAFAVIFGNCLSPMIDFLCKKK